MADPPDALIAVKGLRKEYPAERGTILALEDIDLDVAEGELVAIVGPSGCGKSTLLKIVAGLLPATSGEVRLRSLPVTGPRRDIGVVFQSPVLFPWRTVLDNVLLPVDVQRLGRAKHRGRALDLLKLVGLSGFEDRYPWELSGGMQQRVAITRSLMHDPALLLMDEPFGALDAMTRESLNLELQPSVLLLDEPFSALDALTRERLNVELQALWSRSSATILLVTHSIPEAVFLADRVFVMTARPGRVLDRIEVRIPRPRTLEVMATPEFGRIARAIRAHFNLRAEVDA